MLSSLKILRRYQYDPLDRLTGTGLLTPDSTQRFYQEGHLITEVGQQTQRTIFRHQAQPLAHRQSNAGVSETTLFGTDRARSLLQTVSGKNQQSFGYTVYGHHPADSNLSRLLGFNGECPDDITGNYPLGQGNRLYNSVLMRFMSPDELSPFNEGGINQYAYCENDPVNFYDPTGNAKHAIILLNIKKLPFKKRHFAFKPTPLATTKIDITSGVSTSSVATTAHTSNLKSSTSTPIGLAQPFPHKLKPFSSTTSNPKTKTNVKQYNYRLNSNALRYDELITTPNFQPTSTGAMRTQWEHLASTLKSKKHGLSIYTLKKQQAKLELKIKDFSVTQHELNNTNAVIRS